ncbi:kinase-like domain-containing protein [Aspergillus karnatakaensis]|uniref:phosphotransferase family protein n=1 Tax=Aspergillus karnatakaensis TaxID=1810916 RepID=UPI003CCDCBA8
MIRCHTIKLSFLCTLQATSSSHDNATKDIEPNAYTSGQWLRRDKIDIESRYIQFNFDALCQKVIQLSPGATSINACRKLEGGFNRVFIFRLDNAKQIVARLPFRLAGPARLTTLSEVATIRYLQAKTRIPIPEILDWNHDSGDPSNTVGCEYIIMEHARGVPLREQWHRMAGDQKIRCLQSIYETINGLVDLEFPAFGSIYLDDTIDSADRQSMGDGFCIGPHCGLSIAEYSDALIDCGLSRVPAVDNESAKLPMYHGSPQTHTALLECARAVLKQMSEDPRIRDSATPLLFHPDLHIRNIFVSEDSPSVVTSIIDWQAASVEPAFWYSDETPNFAKAGELCMKAFDACTQFLMSRLSGSRLMDDSLFRPSLYSYRTWKDGAVALRYELYETSRLWEQLGFEGQCPCPKPTPEELVNHQREYKLFEVAQKLRVDLPDLLDTASDGWIPPESWEETQVAHKQTFDGMLQVVLSVPDTDDDEPVKDEWTLKTIWPFDLPQGITSSRSKESILLG